MNNPKTIICESFMGNNKLPEMCYHIKEKLILLNYENNKQIGLYYCLYIILCENQNILFSDFLKKEKKIILLFKNNKVSIKYIMKLWEMYTGLDPMKSFSCDDIIEFKNIEFKNID